jgi:hypothetical protein
MQVTNKQQTDPKIEKKRAEATCGDVVVPQSYFREKLGKAKRANTNGNR